MTTTSKNLIPAAIIFAGLVLSITIIMIRHEETPPVPTGDITKTLPVGPQDHVRGDETPEVTLITYTDLDCPFCKRFHDVIEQLVVEYGEDGGVAFVLRHFPIIDLHPDSGSHAKAAECASSLGGETAFWGFIRALMTANPEGTSFDPRDYGTLAPILSIDASKLLACTNGTGFDDRVARDFENALLIGARGTPYTVVMIDGMDPFGVSGYLPYEGMKTVVERALAQ